MRVMLSLIVTAVIALSPAMAKERNARAPKGAPEITRSEQILKWINEYRHAPEPDRLPDMVRAMGNLGLFRELDSAGVYIGFIAGVIGFVYLWILPGEPHAEPQEVEPKEPTFV